MKRKKGRKDLQPAPGDLGILHSLLNTIDGKTGDDELSSPRKLARWLSRHGLLAAGAELDDADLERVRQVRQAWRSLLAGPAKEEEKGILKALDRATAGATFRTRHRAGGVIRFEPRADGLDGALGRLLSIASKAQADGTWGLLKVCASSTCRTVFYDRSTNHSGKWCRARCGNRLSSRRSKRRSRRLLRQFQESQEAVKRRLEHSTRPRAGTRELPTGDRELDG